MTGITIRNFARKLAPIRDGVVSVNGVSLPLKPIIPVDVVDMLKQIEF